MAETLTKRTLDAALGRAHDGYVWASTPSGFGARVRNGRASFVYEYRPGGGGRAFNKRRLTIGAYPDLTVDRARTEATKLAGAVKAGRDPAADRDAARHEAARVKANGGPLTIARLADAFIERYARRRNRSWAEYRRILDVYVKPVWGNRPVEGIRRADVNGLLDRVEDHNGAVMADHVLAIVRKMFAWHAARDDAFNSPIVRGMARTKPRERARDRTLTDAEIRAVWRAAEAAPLPYGALVRTLLLTGQRRDEVASMRWGEVVGDVWTIPAERYKTKRANVVPLTDDVRAILDSLPRIAVEDGTVAGTFVFSTSGSKPFSGFSKAKTALDAACGVTGWTLHDLRRTARTLMVRANVRPDVAERVLGHVIGGVAGVYDRHDYLAEKRHALEALAGEVRRILAEPPGNVVPIRRTR